MGYRALLIPQLKNNLQRNGRKNEHDSSWNFAKVLDFWHSIIKLTFTVISTLGADTTNIIDVQIPKQASVFVRASESDWQKNIGYYEICPFSVYYKSVKFIVQGPKLFAAISS
jgi:hypothetical protein